MKTKIKEVQDYFADKIARGLYKVTEVNDKYLHIIIDGKYKFGIWTGSGMEHFSLCSIGIETFFQIDFTDEQKKASYKKAFSHVKKYRDTELKESELTELKKLQEKYPEAK